MNEIALKDILALWKIARYDPKCQEIGKRYDELETHFSETVATLGKEYQDLIWAFVTISDELNHRLLEVICQSFNLDPVAYLRKLEESHTK